MSLSPSTIQSSFTISYLVLAGYTIITLIEAIRIKDIRARHILNIETAVSLVAGIMYALFLDKIKQWSGQNPETFFTEITHYRYLDWMITTPLLLLGLILFFQYYQPNTVSFWSILVVLLLNVGMLASGYLGEIQMVDKLHGCLIGFVFFVLMAVYMYMKFVRHTGKHYHPYIFAIFILIWAVYGLVYLLEDETWKQIWYNGLDIVAKALFGVFMWLYFGHVVSFAI